jgi:hypothetical protein
MGKVKEERREAVSPYRLLAIGPDLKRVLAIAYRARRPVLLEGPTGIGKSEIVRQVAADLGIDHVVLDLSLLEPPDLVGLPRIEDNRTSYAAPKMLPTEGRGILMLEELNRAERYIQQPALQLLTGRRLHEYVLPEGWFACAAINPERGDYQVTPLDPALRSRFMNLLVRADRKTWLAWAEDSGCHPAVLRLARGHDRFFEDVPPRTWTYVSDVLKVLLPQEWRDQSLLRLVLIGYLPPSWIEVLVDAFGEDDGQGTETDVAALLLRYHQDAALQKLVRGCAEQGLTDRLEQIAYRVRSVVEGPELNALIGRQSFSLDAFERLLGDLPGAHREPLRDAVAQNRAAAPLAGIQPSSLLRGYDSSPLRKHVEGWAADPARQYRISLLVTGLCHHLEHNVDLVHLRNSRGDMIGLGHFVAQLDERSAAPLWETLKRCNLEPMVPKRSRKPR